MSYTMSDVYAYQMLHYLITRYQYQMVRIQNQKNDFWLMNQANPDYPVICISNQQINDLTIDEAYLRNVHRAILDVIGREGKLLSLNTNASSTMMDKDYMIQLLALPRELKHYDLLHTFNAIEQVPHDVEDPQNECATLTKLLEEYEGTQIHKNKRRLRFKIPKITAGIAIVCSVYFLLIQALMLYFGDLPTGIIAGGAYYKMSVVAMGEYWRILTTGFLHFDIFHLFVNIYTLFHVGMVCEKLYPPKQYLTIFISSLWIGNLFAFIADGNIVNVGISAGIFGLTASFLVVLIENQSIRLPIVRSNFLRLLFLIILLTMMPNTSFIAHLGAIVVGGFLGILFLRNQRWKTLRINTFVSFSALLACVVFFAARVQRVEPVDKEMDNAVIRGFETAGWSGYVERMKDKFQVIYEREMAK